MTISIASHYIEEIELLCDRSGNGKPDRIGIIEAGKLIQSGTLKQFREQYGKALVIKQTENKLESKFLPHSIFGRS